MELTQYAGGSLDMDRCPHCRIANPLLSAVHGLNTSSSSGQTKYKWRLYVCSKCGFPVVGGCYAGDSMIRPDMIFPKPDTIAKGMPAKAEAFLNQAIECIHAPSGAIMLCASSVDAMLKEKGLKVGNLYSRIELAIKGNLITKEMGQWAHEVRLDANDERHADESAALPTVLEAKRCVDFAKALAEFLFILPARIERGRGIEKK